MKLYIAIFLHVNVYLLRLVCWYVSGRTKSPMIVGIPLVFVSNDMGTDDLCVAFVVSCMARHWDRVVRSIG